MSATPADRVRSERGSGTLGTSFGVGVFLMLLAFASHVLLNLWTLNALDAVAYDTAYDIAASGASDTTLDAVRIEATNRARTMLGRLGDDASIAVAVDGEAVGVTISTASLSVLPSRLAAAVGLDHLERTATVTREAPR